jgi:hypothetical protein
MFSPNDPRVKENLPKIKKALLNKDISIYFVPSEKLKKELLAGNNPMIQGIPKTFVTILLENKGLVIQKQMLFKWLEGKLDQKNSYMLSNGEVKIVDSTVNIQNIL